MLFVDDQRLLDTSNGIMSLRVEKNASKNLFFLIE